MAIEGYLQFEHVIFLLKPIVPFPLATAKLIGGCIIEYKKRGQNVPISYNCTTVLAHLIDFFQQVTQGETQKNPQNFKYNKLWFRQYIVTDMLFPPIPLA